MAPREARSPYQPFASFFFAAIGKSVDGIEQRKRKAMGIEIESRLLYEVLGSRK